MADPNPPAEPRGSTFVRLRLPCPRCGAPLERESSGRIANARPVVRCTGCPTEWPEYKNVLFETRAALRAAGKGGEAGATLGAVKQRLMQIKAGIRAGRNVAGGIRAVQDQLGRIAAEASRFQGHDSVNVIGEAVEGIVDQVILASEHLDEAMKGNVPEVYDGKAKEVPLDEDDDEEVAEA